MQLDLFDSPEPAVESTVDSPSGTLITNESAPSSQDRETEQVMYRCTGCKVVKPVSDYYVRTVNKNKPLRVARCKACVKAKSRECNERLSPEHKRERNRRWYEANPEKQAASQRKWNEKNADRLPAIRWENHLWTKYRITPDDYTRIRAEQDGKCAICAISFDELNSRHVHLDHNHKTGAIRALLCGYCNKAIGHARENPDTLLAMAAYLLRYQNVLEMAS